MIQQTHYYPALLYNNLNEEVNQDGFKYKKSFILCKINHIKILKYFINL